MIEKRQFYIDGAWTEALDGRDHEVIDPATEEPCAIIALGGQAARRSATTSIRRTNVSNTIMSTCSVWEHRSWVLSSPKKFSMPFYGLDSARRRIFAAGLPSSKKWRSRPRVN